MIPIETSTTNAVMPASPRSQEHVFALWVQTAALTLAVILPLIIVPWGQDAYSRPKVLVLYGLTLVVIVGWILHRLVDKRVHWTITTPELALWCFVFAALLSSAVSVNPRLTLLGAPGRYEGLLALGAYAVLFFVGANYFGSAGGLRRLTVWVSAAAAVVVVYGLLQPFTSPLFTGEAFLRDWYGGLGILRIPSTIGGPIVFGGYLALLLPMLMALVASERGGIRVVWLAVACLSVVALALTLTRAAWLAALAAIGTYVAASRHVVRSYRLELITVFAAGVLSLGVFVALVGSSADLGARLASGASVETGSLAQRLYIWEHTWRLASQRPWLGWGLETLREIFPYERESLVRYFGTRPVVIDRAHNEFLHMIVSIGFPGGASYILFWALVVVAAVRTSLRLRGHDRLLAAGWLAAIVGYLVQLQFSFSAVALAPIVWLMSGAACGWDATLRGNAGTGGHGNATLRGTS